MRKSLFGLIVLAACALPVKGQERATITIQADKPGAPVPASLYGIFFEEINHAGDGGIYAELIQNRSFDETLPVEGCTLKDGKCFAPTSPSYATGKIRNWSVPWKFNSPHPAWSLEKGQGVDASMAIAQEKPLHPQNPTYLTMKVARLPTGADLRLLNEGYWGIAVKAGETYELSFFARVGQPAIGKVRAGLLDAKNQVLASEEIALAATDWEKYTCSFTAKGTDGKARFFLQPLSSGTLDLDFVSLFPRKTFKNRPNGCRPDLAQLLADMKPAFMRFPGGCVVEGATMENRYQWKKTIGPVHTRPGHWSLWGYRNTDGLGFHEFLQLCEDIGAKGMFVINCGLSCEYRNGDYWPAEKIPELIQDTLDAIEYALGPVDSKWGALRAKAGHPEPLPLKYIEIGNENHGPKYVQLYKQFAARIKQAWPQLTLICNVRLDGTEMEDPHFYVAPPFFFENYRRFDNAPRENAPRIYVGEFAVNNQVGRGNLLAALSEAVFMMGMERNGDLVHMCSYAPLFFNVNRLDWPVNMIGYNAAGSFGRTSYYAQKMFATNLPDVNLSCVTVSSPLKVLSTPGPIGVGTWDTQAEFKDIKVTDKDGKILFADNFAEDKQGYKIVAGDWKLVEGALRQTSDEKGAQVLIGNKGWQDYTLSLKARKISGAEGFLIMFSAGHGGKSWWNLGGWGNKQHGLEAPGVPMDKRTGKIAANRWYDIRIENAGPRVRCYLDGKLIHDVVRGESLSSLYALAGMKKDTHEIILKVVNAAQMPQPCTIKIEGVASLSPKAQLMTMSHEDRTLENSIEAPTRIVPVESVLNDVKPEFTHTFPANSISVLRISTLEKK